jgi:hypothetical protein
MPNLTIDEFAAEEEPQRIGFIAVRDELVRDLGYQSICHMMEQTELVPLPSGGYVYLTTDSDGYWVAWSDQQWRDIQRFESRQAALLGIRDTLDPIFGES